MKIDRARFVFQVDDEEFGKCYRANALSSDFLPIGSACLESGETVEIIVLDDQDSRVAFPVFPGVLEISRWIRDAEAQYALNIEPESFLSRCPQSEEELQDLPGFERWTMTSFKAVYAEFGISPFLRMTRVVFCPASSYVCIDFDCPVECYLAEYPFSLDSKGNFVRFVTPRLGAPFSTYPAS